ncbi:YdeI/OmpD-associated family protein [Umezawaea sp. Da 62-37]|uniref:YdeI/OmpD-associated family protein n=1 Tax=Umezawaea sp. Da 62-37 TaxID=3075927 RepID=UPI0028F70F08|nr:YdeI/OmpD-associated family protein [Umezawaea sp. Da 62-37]WNV84130.1 YdeI/OmpD-associated family protein [Umezawaea sp. Da 62-37]
MEFRAKVLLSGKTATGAQVPAEIVTALGSSRKPAVRATIGTYTYRSSIASMNGVFMLPISAEVRAATGTTANDEITINLELDTDPREITVPDDLATALDPESRRRFDALSYSAKRRLVTPIEDAKTTETRQRRITKTAIDLRG